MLLCIVMVVVQFDQWAERLFIFFTRPRCSIDTLISCTFHQDIFNTLNVLFNLTPFECTDYLNLYYEYLYIDYRVLMCSLMKIVDVNLICLGMLISLLILCTHSRLKQSHPAAVRSQTCGPHPNSILCVVGCPCVHCGVHYGGFMSNWEVGKFRSPNTPERLSNSE